MTESQAKELVIDTLALFGRYAEVTPTTIDDRVVAMVTTAVTSPLLWPWVWTLLQRFLSDDLDPLVAMDCPEPAAAAEAGIDPLTIIAIVKAIAELIKLFRNR